jgi:hypothetical protein
MAAFFIELYELQAGQSIIINFAHSYLIYAGFIIF